MFTEKFHYSLVEAAERVKCKPSDLLHYAVQQKIALLTGVPDGVVVRIHDESTDMDCDAFLTAPQLLTLTQSYCLKIELNGKTVQSDFLEGYFLESSGVLRKLLPSYGRPDLNHRWAFWRTYRDKSVNLLELTLDRLFVLHTDLVRLMNIETDDIPPDEEPIPPKAPQEKRSTQKSAIDTGKEKDVASSAPKKDSTSEELSSADRQPVKQNRSEDSKTQIVSDRKNVTIIRLKEVERRTGLKRSTIYDKMAQKSSRFDGAFPKQVRLGVSSVGWYESEIEAWLDERKRTRL